MQKTRFPNYLISIFLVIIFAKCDSSNTQSYKLQLENSGADFVWQFEREFNYDLKEQSTNEYYKKLVGIQSGADSSIYGIDISSWKIVELDNDLNELTAYGKGGNGYIDESQNFFSIEIEEEKNYFLIDNGYKIKKYSFQRGFLEYRNLPSFTNTMALTKDSVFLLCSEGMNEDGLFFYKYSFLDDSIFEARNILDILKISEPVFMADLVYEGFLCRSSEFIIYIPYKVGQILLFDNKGKSMKTFPTIDETPAPIAKEIDLGNDTYTYETDPPYVHFIDGEIKDNKLYILSTIEKPGKRAIDIYWLPSGDYYGSIQLQDLSDGQKAINFTFIKDDLVVLYENMTLKKYKMNNVSAIK